MAYDYLIVGTGLFGSVFAHWIDVNKVDTEREDT